VVVLFPISPSSLPFPLKHVINATKMCFDQKRTFTQDVLAVVLQQLVELKTLPSLLMRTMLQSLQVCPNLKRL
jgi:symplekin